MALNNYLNLKEAVIQQSHRSDLDLKIDDFILLAETEMRANADEPLNMRLSETTVTDVSVVDSDVVSLPTLYQKARSLRITIGEDLYPLNYRVPSAMNYRSGSGVPVFYTIIGNQIKFDINTDVAYTITFTYVADLSPLTSINTTNSVLTRYPNISLYVCLKHAFIYANDDAELSKYNSLFLSAIKDANNAENLGRYGDTPNVSVGWCP